MSEDVIIRVADWSETPGPREKKHGPYSAEVFVEEKLAAAFERAIATNGTVTIDLDGVAGYLPSFLEETFGGLARKYTTATVEKHLRIICNDDAINLEDAWDYVRNPRPPKRPIS